MRKIDRSFYSFEENLVTAARWKQEQYKGLRSHFINNGSWAKVYTVQIGSRGLLGIPSLDNIEKFASPGKSRSLFLLL